MCNLAGTESDFSVPSMLVLEPLDYMFVYHEFDKHVLYCTVSGRKFVYYSCSQKRFGNLMKKPS